LAGVVHLAQSEEGPLPRPNVGVETAGPPAPPETPGPGQTPPGPGVEPPQTGTASVTPAPAEGAAPDWLKAFREKYPVERPPPPPSGEGTVTNVEFFGVKGDKRPDGTPVEIAPKQPAPAP
jgi:hypothetical protein